MKTAIKQLEQIESDKGIERIVYIWNFMCKGKHYREEHRDLLEDEITDEEGFFHNMTVYELYNTMQINQAGDVCFSLSDRYTWDDEKTGCYCTGTTLEDLTIIQDNAEEFMDYLVNEWNLKYV